MIRSWTFFWLVGGEVSSSLHHQPSGSNWSEVYLLLGSITSIIINFSHLEGILVSAKWLKDIFVCICWWETKTLPQVWVTVSLDYFSLVLHPLPSLINNCLNLELREGGGGWIKLFPVIKGVRDTHRLCVQEPHRTLLGITSFRYKASDWFTYYFESGYKSLSSTWMDCP